MLRSLRRRLARKERFTAGLMVAGAFYPWAQLTQGLLLYGQPASGKSYFLLNLIRELARRRVPMVITTARVTDFEDIRRMFVAEGLEDNLRRATPDGEHRLNLGDFASGVDGKLPGGDPRRLASLLTLVGEILNDSGGGQKAQDFWKGFAAEMYLRATQLVIMATGRANLQDIFDVITSMPTCNEQGKSAEFYTGTACGRMLMKAEAHPDRRTCDQIVEFVVRVANVGEKARGAVQQQTVNVIGSLVSGEFYDFCCTDSTIDFDELESGGSTLVLDAPLLSGGDTARAFQAAVTIAAQFHALARDPAKVGLPLAIIRDEAGLIVNPRHDARVQAVARGQKLMSVAAVQNIELLESQFGGGPQGHQEALAFTATHNTKLFFANSSPATNEYASKLIGEERTFMYGGGTGQPSEDPWHRALGVTGGSFSFHQEFRPRVKPDEFTILDTGTCYVLDHNGYRFVDMREGGRK